MLIFLCGHLSTLREFIFALHLHLSVLITIVGIEADSSAMTHSFVLQPDISTVKTVCFSLHVSVLCLVERMLKDVEQTLSLPTVDTQRKV